MKLDRNLNENGRGKYALLLLREIDALLTQPGDGSFFGGLLPEKVHEALATLEEFGIIDYGIVGTDTEFFVMRLKDRNAGAGLRGYAESALERDAEWANEVLSMEMRAGPKSPWCKEPD